MSVLDTAKAHSSVRAYKEQTVEEEKLQKILETAHVAPTAANIYGDSVAVVLCADKSKAWIHPFDGMVTTD